MANSWTHPTSTNNVLGPSCIFRFGGMIKTTRGSGRGGGRRGDPVGRQLIILIDEHTVSLQVPDPKGKVVDRAYNDGTTVILEERIVEPIR